MDKFDLPIISTEKRKQTENVWVAHTQSPIKILAEWYEQNKTPESLRKIHIIFDDVVESIYPSHPFGSNKV